MVDLLHPTYLPITADQLREHFAPVAGTGEEDRHLTYYRASLDEAKKYDELIRGGVKPMLAQTRLGRQMEKDERFWLAAALMTLYHANGGSARTEAYARLFERAGLAPGPGFSRWEDALAIHWTCSSKSISHRLAVTVAGFAIIWISGFQSPTSGRMSQRRGRFLILTCRSPL